MKPAARKTVIKAKLIKKKATPKKSPKKTKKILSHPNFECYVCFEHIANKPVIKSQEWNRPSKKLVILRLPCKHEICSRCVRLGFNKRCQCGQKMIFAEDSDSDSDSDCDSDSSDSDSSDSGCDSDSDCESSSCESGYCYSDDSDSDGW